MPVFEYKALNANGKNRKGIVDADSTVSAQAKLRQQNLFPVSIDRISSEAEGLKNKGGRKNFKIRAFFRISASEVSMITRLTATLLSAGFPLVNSVAAVADQTQSKALKKVLSRVKDAVEEGSSFADALSLYPKVFSSVYINMVKAGETSGTLEIVMERLADFGEKRVETQKKILAALAYPIIMAMVGFLVLIILLTYIVPDIVQIFSDLNQALPLLTQLLIEVSDFFVNYWWAVILIPLIICGTLLGVRKTEKGVLMTDRAVLALPLVGLLIQKLIAARFLRTLGVLLENGVPMLASLKIARSITGNRVVSDLMISAALQVEQGGELGKTLAQSRVFPKLAVQMIKVGEKSGEIEKMLSKSADFYEKDVQAAITATTTVIEPIIILFMGVVVGLIIMAICLPIVEINQFVV